MANAIQKWMQSLIAGNVGTICLKEEHHWHSLREAMRCFHSKDPTESDAWKSLIEDIEVVCSTQDFLIKLNDEVARTKSGTGSLQANNCVVE